MKKIVFLGLLIVMALRTSAQSVLTTNGILSQISDTITTNGSRQITGATLNGLMKNQAVSYVNKLNLIASSPLSWTSGSNTLNIALATGSTNGYLSSADWTRFNSNSLPSQGGKNGLFLKTNGSTVLWDSAGKTYHAGFGLLLNTGTNTFSVDASIGDTIFITNYGGATGHKMLLGSNDTLFSPNLIAGSGLTITEGGNHALTLAASGSSTGSLGDIQYSAGSGTFASNPAFHINTPTNKVGINIGTASIAAQLHVFSSVTTNATTKVLLVENNDGTYDNTFSVRGTGDFYRGNQEWSPNDNTVMVTGWGRNALGAMTLTNNVPNDTDLTAIGTQAMGNLTSGNKHCIGIGAFALNGSSPSVLFNNVAIGYKCMGKATKDSNNVAVGYFAMQGNTKGNENVAIGDHALQADSGDANTGVGKNVMFNLSTGTRNTFMGHNVGHATAGGNGLTTGSDNVAIGTDTTGSCAQQYHGRVELGAQTGFHLLGNNVTFLGKGAYSATGSTIDVHNSIAVGTNVALSDTGELVFGSLSAPIKNVWFNGDSIAGLFSNSPLYIHQGIADPGTDKSAYSTVFVGGSCTGAGHGGSWIFQAASAGVTGGTRHQPLTRFVINATANREDVDNSNLQLRWNSLGSAAEVRFEASDTIHYVGFKAPSSIASNKIWTLPSVDATITGQVLSSNASGTLSWIANGAQNHTVYTPANTDSVKIVKAEYSIVKPAGTIAGCIVKLPSSPLNNDFVEMKFTQVVTTITYANGTVGDPVTTADIGTYIKLVYHSGDSTWY